MEKSSAAAKQTQDLMQNKYVWIVGAVILVIAGWFGFRFIFALPENYQVSLIDAPKEIFIGNTATFTWRIDGPGTTINHTAVHLGTKSNTGELDENVKPEDTSYDLAIQDFANGNYGIPLQFVGNITLDTPGKYYYRVHAVIKDKNYWTDEYSIDVKPLENSVFLVNVPTEATVNDIVTFTWRVEGPPTTIKHTSIHYGLTSNPGELEKSVKPEETKYRDLIKDFANGNYNIPLTFVGNTQFTSPGTYYFRGHAIIGDENYWTDEKTITVKARSAANEPTSEPTGQ